MSSSSITELHLDQNKATSILSEINAKGHLILDNEKKPAYPSKDWQARENQLDVETAIKYAHDYGTSVRGIAVIAGPELLIFDFDEVDDDNLKNAAGYGITREEIDETRDVMSKTLKENTYVECSHSGTGHHAVLRVSRSYVGRRASKLLKRVFAIDVIHGNKYCHITGARENDLPVASGNDEISELFDSLERAYPEPTVHCATGDIGVDWLADAEVWQVIRQHRPKTYARVGYGGECDFSDTMVQIIGDLAKVTSDPNQANRMLIRTPVLTTPVRCEGGRTERIDKYRKLFDHWWQEAREHNDAGLPLIVKDAGTRLPSIEHGAAVVARLDEIEEKRKQAFALANPLPEPTERSTRSQYTTMPEPQGPIAVVARWIYNDVMNDPQRDLAILGAWLLVASFAGRKDSLKSNPPVVQARMLAMNATGKDSIRRARAAILDGLKQRYFQNKDALTPNHLACLDMLNSSFGTQRMVRDELSVLSSLSFVPEAGIAKRSKAGDADSVRAAVMQNFAQNAYERRTYKAFAENMPLPYGVNVSYLEESTKETFIEFQGGQVSTGETARALTFQIDASDIGQSQLHDSKPTPKQVLDIFEALVNEALRDEDFNQTAGKGDKAFIAPSRRPVPYESRRVFQCDAQTEARINQLLDERTEFRRGYKSNVSDLAWAQRARYEQLMLRLTLVHARTRHICSGNPNATEVTLQDLNAALAVVDESRRTESANITDYDSPMARLISSMHEFAIAELSKKVGTPPGPSGNYRTKMGEHYEQHLKERRLNSRMFTGSGTNRKHMQAANALVSDRTFRTVNDAIRTAALEGGEQGIWKFETGSNGRWSVCEVASP